MSAATLLQTSLSDLELTRRGKVRDVYAVDDERLLIVATDRISAFDCVLPTPIERKGEVLTALSQFWFDKLGHVVANHLLTSDISQMPENIQRHWQVLARRSMLVKRAEVFPVECVVRGYLVGSGWKDYLKTGEVCGHKLPENLQESAELPEPLFTPSTKAEQGHDENISEAQVRDIVGAETTALLRDTSLRLYSEARNYARERGIIIADTKFEFGLDKNGELVLIDEVLTPDSSRFWPADQYQPGRSQPSFDKQFVRDYLETLNWDKKPPAPAIPPEVAQATTERYVEAYKLLAGKNFNQSATASSQKIEVVRDPICTIDLKTHLMKCWKAKSYWTRPWPSSKTLYKEGLIRHKQHLSKTAAAIGIHRNTLSKRVASYHKQERRTDSRTVKKTARR
jgi:phosphoribosylaminoimidazole-succinocarboxamide synthase